MKDDPNGDEGDSHTGFIIPDLEDDESGDDPAPGQLSGKTYINIVNPAFDPSEIGNLPISYDLRDYGWVTSVKNQASSGSCWAFASTAALESFLLKTEGIEYDFSENNMKNIMGSYSINGTDYGPNDGGNEVLILSYLLRWSGPVLESDDPYDPSSTVSPYNLTTIKYVQDVLWVPKRTGPTDNDQIKWALMNYGALYTGIYWDDSFSKGESYYYYGVNPYGNHAITIVGWDDTYSKDNFRYAPPGDGAFLIKNSWGEDHGNEGYYYVSYYDNVFAGRGSNEYFSAMAFTNVENTSYYKNNYFHDLFGNTFDAVGYKNETAWFANQFTAESNNPLKAFGFYTYGSSEYSAYIYVNSTLKHTQSGTINGAGYHTVKLDEMVDLFVGDIFDIAIKLTTPNCDYPIAIENYHSGFTGKATANANESFVSSNGIVWEDLTTIGGYSKANVCLKAYTDYAANMIINAISNASFYSNGDEVELTINITNYGDLSSADVYSLLDEHASIISYEASGGIFDPASRIWSLDDMDEEESQILRLVIQISTTQANITNTFYINSSLYNMNKENGTLNLFRRVNASLSSNGLETDYCSGERFEVKIVDEDEIALSDVEVCFKVYDESNSLIGTYYNTTDDEGIVYLSSNFNAGSYSVEISLVNPYYEGNLIGTIHILKSSTKLSSIDSNAILNKTSQIVAYVMNGEKSVNEGNVSFYINGLEIGNSDVADGMAVIEYAHNLVGSFEVTAIYNENGNYHSSQNISSLNVDKITAQISSEDISISYEDSYHYNVGIFDEWNNGIKGIQVLFNIYQNDELLANNYLNTGLDGIASLAIDLSAGDYTIESKILDGEYQGSANNTLSISKATAKLAGSQIGNGYGNTALLLRLSQIMTDKAFANQKVLVSFSNGKIYRLTTDNNGEALLNIDFDAGEYSYQLSSASSNIIAKSAGSLIIEKAKAALEASSVIKYFGENAKLEAKLTDSNGNPIAGKTITFTVNGKDFSAITDSNGIASVDSDFEVGKYIVSMLFNDSNFQMAQRNIELDVLAIPVQIEAKDLKKYYGNNAQLSITLKDNKNNVLANKEVKFTIAGKTYAITTDSNGIATLKIDNKAGKYTVKASFSANGYQSMSKTVNANVLKPKIIVKKTVVKKGKKLTVLFKDANGKPIKKQKVILKINGKAFAKKTNAKGKAILKMNFKKGKYTLVSSFAKNSVYGKTSKKTKIRVK